MTNTNRNRYFYNGKELQDQVIGGTAFGKYDYVARFYDPELDRWHSVDPLAEKYYSISPCVYVVNNPIRAIDSDGRDIIVLNNPKGASGCGHMAVLIGSDKNGWRFISKEGRDKTSWHLNELTGSPAAKPLIAKFKTKADFDKARSKKKI